MIDTAQAPPVLKKEPVKGPAPSSRGLHTLVHVENALYLYGGAPQSGPMLGDLWRLDLDNMQWQELQPAGPQPHVRCSAAAAAVADGRILFFGGAFYGSSGGLEMLQDVFLYDSASNTWMTPDEQALESAEGGSGGKAPAGRNAAVMVPLGKQLLLYGGWQAFNETYNDSYIVSVEV